MSHLVLSILTSHLSASNDGSGQRCSQKVSLLVDGVALNCAVAELINELLAEILNDPFTGSANVA